jgi:GTP pyrophosphokinase
MIDINSWLESIQSSVPQADQEIIRRAYEIAAMAHDGQIRASGEPYIKHSLAVAQMLAELRLDTTTLIAALLHDVPEDTEVTLEEIRQEFGDEVATLVDGVTKLGQIDHITSMSQRNLGDNAKAESLRKMFLAMADDVRVVLIKLADRLHNMRTLSALPEEKRKRIAQETLEIFAPLADRLGIWQMKWELEDLAFRNLEPETYRKIAKLVAERRLERERRLNEISQILQKALHEAGISAEVSGRPKHIYSINRKMRRKGVDFDQIYDVQGVRIIVEEVRDCYAALGVVHTLWPPIPGEFDDYIATPKDNMYRSLHTAVHGPNGKPLEVQIRTTEMHRIADLGIAAHWRYKEGVKADPIFDNKINWLRSLMEWRQDVTDAWEFLDSLKTDVFQDRVYTFTPKGDVVDMPSGSTPIDFAYHIHTQIGHRCRGAKVNGRLVSLNYKLRNGDQVEILTAKRGGPSRDWLNPDLGYTETSRARNKIRQWFKRLDQDENITEGRAILEREFKRLGVEGISHEGFAKTLGYNKTEDLYTAIGAGDIHAQQIATKVLELQRPKEEEAELSEVPWTAPPTPAGIKVRGAGNLLTNLAGCCHPLPGDAIVGYVTRGRGVTIHRKDCRNILALRDRERLIEVDWGRDTETYPVAIKVIAYDRGGLLRDLAAVVADADINMSAANVVTRKKDNMAIFTATLEISSITQLAKVLAKIEQLRNVVEARRQAT